jgi:2'-5' RNA ligase
MERSLRMKRTAIAYWLIPAEPAYGILENLIAKLACRYNAPVFEPHLTIHVGLNRVRAGQKVILQAVRWKPLSLRLRDVGHSNKFTKTLFVRLAPSIELRRLNEIIRSAAQDSSHYPLQPHFSLLYKRMPVASRRELAASINLPFSEVVLDSIKAVRCALPTSTPSDVVKWRVLASAALSRL